MNISQARDQFSQAVNQVLRGQIRVLVQKRGRPVAAIISVEDLRELQWMEARRAERFKVIDQMREAFTDVPEDDIDREVDKAQAEVRAEARAAKQRQQPKSTRSD